MGSKKQQRAAGGLDEADIARIESSFALVAPRGAEVVERFYALLFQRYPDVKPMFAHADMAKQKKALLGALALVVKNLRAPNVLARALRDLGRRHAGYGAQPAHYEAVGGVLLDVLAEIAGAAFTPAVKRAWAAAYGVVAKTMIDATNKEPAMKTMPVQESAEAVRMRAAIENLRSAVMMVDRDLVITYANRATFELIRKNEADFKTAFASFQADSLVGACIDVFHKNPAHQKRILSDPRNLPHRADIRVGKLVFEINVTAIVDAGGNYLGNTLEWQDVTQQRARANEVARLTGAIEGATTCLMMVDRDLVITYANEATRRLLNRRENEIRRAFPSFEASKLVGTCIDVFHKNPAHQRRMLEDPSRLPHAAEIKVGDLTFSIKVSAVRDAGGAYVGNTLEWEDVTEQRDAQAQVERLIARATDGQLDTRIEAANYQGFMKALALGVNQLMDAVVGPIREATRVVDALSNGLLTESMTGDFKGDFATLRDAINKSMDKLREMVLKINQSAETITSGASDIAEGNANLNKRTQEQASSLEETASSIEEMTATVKQNANNSTQANQLASAARDTAEKGGQVVGSAVQAMVAITESSKKVADIIGVIEQIAFQTNMLALNAAVEAARAGDQGRGFAVVAAEVRTLAQRSAGAAKEIKGLIQDSADKVDQGAKLVTRSGETLQEIVTSVKKVSDIIAEISSASDEQASGIDQINSAVASMDKTTQQNAAMVEEAAAAAESMNEQARALVDLVTFFKLGEGETVLAATSSRPKTPARTQAPEPRASKSPPPSKPTKTAAAPSASSGQATGVSKPAASRGDDKDWKQF